MRQAKAALISLATVSFLAVPARGEIVQARWLAPTSGLWPDASLWSSSPFSPNNGTPAGTEYDVVIDAIGAPYDVNVSLTRQVRSLKIDSPDLDLRVQLLSATFAATTLDLHRGRLSLTGTIRDTRVVGHNLAATEVVTTDTDCTLDRVTLAGELGLFAEGTFGTVARYNIRRSLTLDNAVVRLTPRSAAEDAVLFTADADQSIKGTGEIVFDSYGTYNNCLIDNGRAGGFGAMLTIEPGITIRTGTGGGQIGGRYGLLVNQGRIISQSLHDLEIVGPMINTGTVEARSGGKIYRFLPSPNEGPYLIDGESSQVLFQTTSQQEYSFGKRVRITNGGMLSAPGKCHIVDTIDLNGYAIFGPKDDAHRNELVNELLSGYAGGSWAGEGISSVQANGSSVRLGIGFAHGAQVINGPFYTFGGLAPGADSLLMRLTLNGDTDLNGTVNLNDFARHAAHFNLAADWFDGDFTYDGIADIRDFALLAANFNQTFSFGTSRASIPEPVTLGVICAVAGLLNRSRPFRMVMRDDTRFSSGVKCPPLAAGGFITRRRHA